MATLGDLSAHTDCTLTACLNPLHPGPCKGWKHHPEEEFHKVAGQAKKGIGAYNVPRGTRGAKAAHKGALLSYVNGSGPINRSLRHSKGAGSNHPQIVSEINAMDRLMNQSKLTRPIAVLRAVSPSAFGGRDTNVDLTGAEYVDHAFGSTGTDLGKILQHFHTTSGGRRPLIATMVLPKGMSAVRAPIGQYGDEKEILVDRGANYRVVKDNGFIDTPKGRFRHVTIEVTPGSKARVRQVDLGDNNQAPRSSVQASADDSCQFCLETHKPGLCKGQKRGQTEAADQDPTRAPKVQRAKRALTLLQQAAQRAQAIAVQQAAKDPKLAAMARRAAADYRRAAEPHRQTLRDAAQRGMREQSGLDEQRKAERGKPTKMMPGRLRKKRTTPRESQGERK